MTQKVWVFQKRQYLFATTYIENREIFKKIYNNNKKTQNYIYSDKNLYNFYINLRVVIFRYVEIKNLYINYTFYKVDDNFDNVTLYSSKSNKK